MMFSTDIELLLNKNANIYCVRLPEVPYIVSGYSSKLLSHPTENSFVISDFDGSTSFIANDLTEASHKLLFDNRIYKSTSREDYHHGLNSIVNELKNKGGKTVYSRVICMENKTDIPQLFDSLCAEYPQAYVFMYRTEKHGLWIGASPELLMKAADGEYDTMSLAGTRLKDTQGEWDAKNLEEQQMVTDFITTTLSRYFATIIKQPVQTRIAGPVEHLCTHISARQPIPGGDIFRMLTDLSPTPALCGLPRDKARQMIASHEHHSRMCYGGFTGIYNNPYNFELYVNLRSMKVTDGAINLFAGGGLTHLSDAESEWVETERKASTLLSLISQ